jgi:hypothetical protein
MTSRKSGEGWRDVGHVGGSALVVLLMAMSGLVGCGERPPRLADKETFVWGEQGIRFAPPAGEDWERHRWQQGGLEGVSFQIRRVPAGRILVAEYRSLRRRHSRIGSHSGRVDFEAAPEDATLDDVLDRVLFNPASLPSPERVETTEVVRTTIGGLRAATLDFTWHDGRTTLSGREVYVLAGGALFKLALLGTADDLELFDEVVASVEFPAPEEVS